MEKNFSMKVFSFNELSEADMNSILGGASTATCTGHECCVFSCSSHGIVSRI